MNELERDICQSTVRATGADNNVPGYQVLGATEQEDSRASRSAPDFGSISSSEIADALLGVTLLRSLAPEASFESLLKDLGRPENGDLAETASPGSCHSPLDTPVDFLSRFEILEALGKGGFGTVFLARDRKLGRHVAVKVYSASVVASAVLQQRFLAEAQTMADLKHPGIVPIYDAGAEGALWYLVMEYCAGPTLLTWLHDQPTRQAAPRLAAKIVARLADTVHHAHSQGILHCDIKPSNVLLEPIVQPVLGFPYSLKLSDFGLARSVDPERDSAASGVLAGTVRYMAPEQATGVRQDVGAQTDVYGLGALLYELLTGSPPLADVSAAQWWRVVAEQAPQQVRSIAPGVSRDLAAICHRCLAKKSTDRYASAQALREDLGRYLNGEPVLARPVGPARRFNRWCRRRPAIAGLAAALTAAMFLGLVLTSWQWRRAERHLIETNRQFRLAQVERDKSEAALVVLGWSNDDSYLSGKSGSADARSFREEVHRDLDQLLQEQPQLVSLFVSDGVGANEEYLDPRNTATAEVELARRRQSLLIWYELVHRKPQRPQYRRCLAARLLQYSIDTGKGGGTPRANGATLLAELLPRHTFRDVLDWEVAAFLESLWIERGDALTSISQHASALDAYQLASDLSTKLHAAIPPDSRRRLAAAGLTMKLGSCLEQCGELAAGTTAFEAAVRQLIDLRTSAEIWPDAMKQLADALEALARFRGRRGDDAGEFAALKQALSLRLELIRPPDAAPELVVKAADLSLRVAEATEAKGDTPQALDAWKCCRLVNWRMRLEGHWLPTEVRVLAEICYRLAIWQYKSGRSMEARAMLQEAIDCYDSPLWTNEALHEYGFGYGACLFHLADVQERSGDIMSARTHFERLLMHYERLAAVDPDNALVTTHADEVRIRLAALR